MFLLSIAPGRSLSFLLLVLLAGFLSLSSAPSVQAAPIRELFHVHVRVGIDAPSGPTESEFDAMVILDAQPDSIFDPGDGLDRLPVYPRSLQSTEFDVAGLGKSIVEFRQDTPGGGCFYPNFPDPDPYYLPEPSPGDPWPNSNYVPDPGPYSGPYFGPYFGSPMHYYDPAGWGTTRLLKKEPHNYLPGAFEVPPLGGLGLLPATFRMEAWAQFAPPGDPLLRQCKLHNEIPIVIEGETFEIPPPPGETYFMTNPLPIPLLKNDSSPSGFSLNWMTIETIEPVGGTTEILTNRDYADSEEVAGGGLSPATIFVVLAGAVSALAAGIWYRREAST